MLLVVGGLGLLALATGLFGLVGGVLTAAGIALGVASSALPVPSAREVDWNHRFEEELERARRFGHPLTLVRVPLAHPEASSFLLHPSGMTGMARRIDLAWMEGGDLYLTLYDTRGEGAAVVLERLRRRGVEPSAARIAVFPDGALTAGAMRQQISGEPDIERRPFWVAPNPRAADLTSLDLEPPASTG
ncbi:MAG: hypothetical protein ABIP36_06575 [Acidimicrobiales bacterium]